VRPKPPPTFMERWKARCDLPEALVKRASLHRLVENKFFKVSATLPHYAPTLGSMRRHLVHGQRLHPHPHPHPHPSPSPSPFTLTLTLHPHPHPHQIFFLACILGNTILVSMFSPYRSGAMQNAYDTAGWTFAAFFYLEMFLKIGGAPRPGWPHP
jgi:hypothetical protein